MFEIIYVTFSSSLQLKTKDIAEGSQRGRKHIKTSTQRRGCIHTSTAKVWVYNLVFF